MGPVRPKKLLTWNSSVIPIHVALPPVLLQGSAPLVTTSEVIALRTQPIALPVVLVLFSVALLAGVAVAVVVFFLVRRCV